MHREQSPLIQKGFHMSEATQLNLAAIADRYAAAWLSHDPQAIVALHAPDSTFQAHGRSGEVKGKAALLKEFAGVFELYPNFGVEIRRLLLGDKHWTLDWDLTFHPPARSPENSMRWMSWKWMVTDLSQGKTPSSISLK